MIDSELLEILCCPETKQPVTLLEGEAIDRVNEQIAAGGVKNRGGQAVEGKDRRRALERRPQVSLPDPGRDPHHARRRSHPLRGLRPEELALPCFPTSSLSGASPGNRPREGGRSPRKVPFLGPSHLALVALCPSSLSRRLRTPPHRVHSMGLQLHHSQSPRSPHHRTF